MDIVEHLKGWERVVEDYCKENYVTDVQTVNMFLNQTGDTNVHKT